MEGGNRERREGKGGWKEEIERGEKGRENGRRKWGKGGGEKGRENGRRKWREGST